MGRTCQRSKSLFKPKGTVPKPEKGKDLWRDIADTREGNKSMADWGLRLFTARDLVSEIYWRCILDGFDVNDGYNIAPLTGCTGNLVQGFGIVGVRRFYDCNFVGKPNFEPPVLMGADGSFQLAPGPHDQQV